MDKPKLQIKLSYIHGLKKVVLNELIKNSNFYVTEENDDCVYIEFSKENIIDVPQLRSVARVYITTQDKKYHPSYISNHKSILGNIIEIILSNKKNKFKNFKINCAGEDSVEVRNIAKYIKEEYGLVEKLAQEDADLKIHIIKIGEMWEIGVAITPRPLSFRDYKIQNMAGAMDPTIAYAMNSFCELEKAKSYLNIFSGSATLLIEAGQCYKNLTKIVGFDNNKKHLSLAIQNIKTAGLIKKIDLKEIDIFNKPDIGTFDAIASDLPFGMAISKDEDLENLYQYFIDYCQKTLNNGGILVVYTSKHKILKEILMKSKFKITKELDLKFITSVDAYIRPKIFVCELK